jgi:iron complex transport system ATP-binding protein
MPQVLLQTEELSIGYAGHSLLTGLNLTLPAATLSILLGRNGGGKSTLIRTLAGLLPALRGTIRTQTGTVSPASNTEWLARQIAVVLTERPHTQFMSGYELVALGRAPYTNWTGRLTAHDRQLIEQALHITHATDLQHCLIEELSDGQCQKLMIARAIAQDTPILLLDEPMSHLDLANSALLLNSLSAYAKANRKAILLSSHHIELAIHAADFIWLIDHDNQLHNNIPEQLVLEDKIGHIFSGTHIFFNRYTGHFNFPKPTTQYIVYADLHLSEISSHWLVHALAKRGIQLQPATDAQWQISQPATHMQQYRWQYGSEIGQTDLAGIVQLLADYVQKQQLTNF